MNVLQKVLKERYPSVAEQERKALADYAGTHGSVTITGAPLLASGPPGLSSVMTMTPGTAVSRGMTQNSWLHTALTKKARAFASVSLVLECKTRKGWSQDSGSKEARALTSLLSQPNPHMSMQDCMERWVMHLEITGNAVAHRVRGSDGRLLELWPVDPSHIRPKRTIQKDDFDMGYLFRPKAWADEVKLKSTDVVHWMYQHPADPRWGLAPLLSAALAVDTDITAAAWNLRSLRDGAKPLGAVLMPDTLDDDQWNLATEQINQAARDRLRQFLVFSGATDIKSLGFSPTDMDFLAGRKFSRDEICAVLGVPSILVSQGQDATYSNMEAAKRGFWEDTIVPLLADFTKTLASALLADFGLDGSKWRIRADLTDVAALRENEGVRLANIQKQATAAAALLRGGEFTPESIAEAVGLPLITVAQAQAVQALSSLSKAAREHIEHKHALVIADLSPGEALALVRELKTPGGEA